MKFSVLFVSRLSAPVHRSSAAPLCSPQPLIICISLILLIAFLLFASAFHTSLALLPPLITHMCVSTGRMSRRSPSISFRTNLYISFLLQQKRYLSILRSLFWSYVDQFMNSVQTRNQSLTRTRPGTIGCESQLATIETGKINKQTILCGSSAFDLTARHSNILANKHFSRSRFYSESEFQRSLGEQLSKIAQDYRGQPTLRPRSASVYQF